MRVVKNLGIKEDKRSHDEEGRMEDREGVKDQGTVRLEGRVGNKKAEELKRRSKKGC